MLKHELYKIISTKAIVFLTALVLIINVLLLWQMEKDKTTYTADEYMTEWAAIIAEAEVSGWEAVLAGFADKLAAFDETGLNAQERYALRNSESYHMKSLYTDIQTELEFLTDYKGYLDGIDKAAERYEKIALFGRTDGYAYRDIMKMRTLYADIERIELVPAPSAGVEMAATSGITDILALVVLLCIAVTVWLKEREQNMMLLLRTTYRGRVSLAASKLAVMVISCMFLGVGLYGGNALAASLMYGGLGDLTRPLASVYDYGHTLWEISVGEFLVLNALFKITAYIWVSLLISAVCCKLTSSVAAFGGIVLFGAADCLMYYKIPYLSTMVAFKYLNPFAVLKTELLFADYNGLNFFEYPVDYRVCMAVLLPVGIILFTVLAVKFFTDYIIKGAKRKKWIFARAVSGVRSLVVRLRRKLEKHTALLGHELYRVLVCYGAGLVLVVLVVFVIHDSKPYEVKYSSLEYYCEHMYLNELKGPVTDEKLAYIEAEQERVRKLSDEYSRAQMKALMMIRSRVSYAQRNEGACLIYDAPHNRLTAAYGNNADFMRMVVCMVPLTLIMPCFFAPDLQTGVCKVTDVTRRGKRGLKCMRYITGTVLAVLTALVANIPYFVQVMISYEVDTEVLSYPINSLQHLSGLGNVMSIGMYYVIIYALRVIFTVLGAFFIYGLSRLLKSQAYTTLAGFMVLVVPVLAVMYDIRLEPVMLPYSMALGNMFMQDKTAAVWCMAAVVLVSAAMKLLIRVRAKR